MRLVKFGNGAKFSMWVIDFSDDPAVSDCPVKEFLDELAADAKRSHDSLVAILDLHANHGPITNKRKSRDEGDDLYAFKNPYNARILYFYMPGGRTVMTHGFKKKGDKLPPNEKRRALAIKAQVEELQE